MVSLDNEADFSASFSHPNKLHNSKDTLSHEESLIPSDLLSVSTLTDTQERTIAKFSSVSIRQTMLNRQIYFFLFYAPTEFLVLQLRTHKGSVNLQYMLSFLSKNEIKILLARLSPYMIQLMCAHYGNYFIQKFLLLLNLQQRLYLIGLISENFLYICGNKSGTYSIQSLIDAIQTEAEEKLLEKLFCKNLPFLFCNENAHHVVQKLIIDYPEHKREYINNFVIQNIEKLCLNEYGKTCVSKFIVMNSNLKIRFQLIQEFENKMYSFFDSEYGCEVLVVLMEKLNLSYSSKIITEIKKNIFSFVTKYQFMGIIIEKVLSLICKYDNREYVSMMWKFIKNENLIYKIYKDTNGKRILSSIIKDLTNEQKSLFYNRYKNLELD